MLANQAVQSGLKENAMLIGKANSADVLKLSGELRINVAEELRSALLEFVCTASRPVVDLSEATECDTAGLQLLISARRTADRLVKRFELTNVPGIVRDAGAALGLSVTAGLVDSGAGSPRAVDDRQI